MVIAVIIAGVGLVGYRTSDEALARKRLPSPIADSPNVVLVVLDTVRLDSLSVYGNSDAQTPNIERFAKQAAVFDNALAPSSWTLPTHASMFTGKFPHELSADWFSPLDDQYPTLAEVMRDHGYATGGFVANTGYCGRPTGLDRGFIHYDDCTRSISEVLCHSRPISLFVNSDLGSSWLGVYDRMGRKGGKQVTDECLNWLDHQRDHPFFAFLNYCDAHDPYLPDRLVGKDRPLTHREKVLMKNWWLMDVNEIEEEDIRLARACYDSKVHELDQELGALMDGLADRGLLDNTIFIVTSDHGEQFGEHGLYYHGNSLYRSLVHVPLVVSWPRRILDGRCVHEPVTLRDLSVTILELTGIDNKEHLGGNSLADLCIRDGDWETHGTSQLLSTVNPNHKMDESPLHRFSPLEKGTIHSLLEDGKYLIRNGDGEREMYDFVTDVAEELNLAGDAAHQTQLQQIQSSLDRLLQDASGVKGIAEGPESQEKEPSTGGKL